jgi:hypothetical protein
MSATEPKIDGVVTLENVVFNVMNDLQDYSQANKLRLMQFAIRGTTELNLYYLNVPEIMEFVISDNYTVDLPLDYIDYIAVSINVNGEWVPLSVNDRIVLPRNESCGEVESRTAAQLKGRTVYTDSETTSSYGTLGVPYKTGYYNSFYGYRGGHNRSLYRIDKDRRQIVFQSSVDRTSGILEYISSGVSLSGKTYVSRSALEALIAFVHWKNVENDASVPMNAKQYREMRYGTEIRKLYAFETAFTIYEFMDARYGSYKQTPKR